MDRITIFVYYFTMVLRRPQVRLLAIVLEQRARRSVPLSEEDHRADAGPDCSCVAQHGDQPPVTHFHAHFLINAPFNRLYSKIYIFKAETDMKRIINALPTELV